MSHHHWHGGFGYLERNYTDPSLPNIRGPTLDGSLTWLASALTTFVNESTLAGVSGVFTHEVGIEVDHAFRTWLDATLKFIGDRDAYVVSRASTTAMPPPRGSPSS